MPLQFHAECAAGPEWLAALGILFASVPAISRPISGDGMVDVDDLLLVINSWGPCPSPPESCQGDITGSGAVDVDDLLDVINAWGPCD